MRFVNGVLLVLNSEVLGQLLAVLLVIAALVALVFVLGKLLFFLCGKAQDAYSGVGPLPSAKPRPSFMELEPLSGNGTTIGKTDPRHFEGPNR